MLVLVYIIFCTLVSHWNSIQGLKLYYFHDFWGEFVLTKIIDLILGRDLGDGLTNYVLGFVFLVFWINLFFLCPLFLYVQLLIWIPLMVQVCILCIDPKLFTWYCSCCCHRCRQICNSREWDGIWINKTHIKLFIYRWDMLKVFIM